MKILKKIMSFKVYGWVILIFLIIASVLYFSRERGSNALVNQTSSSIVKSIEEVNEQVFLNVGIEDVVSQTNNTKIPWTKIGIPLSEKRAIIILNYQAKFGIKKPVRVETIEEKKYKITIPTYEVIGVQLDEEAPYQLYDSAGQLLSYSTENIDTGELVTQSLSDKKQQKYLQQYQKQLDESAKNYFQTLFKAVDSDIVLEFEFDH